ncbi:MAG: RnfABCDGE type electron transport complex subunit C [Bacilli bacterium]
MPGLKLPKHKHESMTKIKNLNIPKIVYIKTDNKIKIGDYVKKGQILSNDKNPGISSVSGHVIGLKEMNTVKGTFLCAEVENDLKETPIKVDLNLSFEDKLEKCGIIGMGGAGFPANIKYRTDKKIKTLLVNAVECEPYITADWALIMSHSEEILETIDKIIKIKDIDKAIIAIKKTNIDLIEEVNKYIGTYPNISLKKVRDIYPMGYEKTLIKECLNETYETIPLEKGIIVNNVSTIFAMKNLEPLTERIITITGEGIKNKGNIQAKIGTKISELIKAVGGKETDSIIITGGPMMGTIAPKDLILTADLNCLLVLPKKEEEITTECLRCGKCAQACPVSLSPVFIMNADPSELKKLNPNKCIECGLCSYICPARINLREIVKKAKEEVK